MDIEGWRLFFGRMVIHLLMHLYLHMRVWQGSAQNYLSGGYPGDELLA